MLLPPHFTLNLAYVCWTALIPATYCSRNLMWVWYYRLKAYHLLEEFLVTEVVRHRIGAAGGPLANSERSRATTWWTVRSFATEP